MPEPTKPPCRIITGPRVFVLYAIGVFLMFGYQWHNGCVDARGDDLRALCSAVTAGIWPAMGIFYGSIKLMDPANLAIPKIRIDW